MNPIVEMDGDEMTRVIWQEIKDGLLSPFVELNTDASTPDWLKVDTTKLTAEVLRVPTAEEIASIVNVQLIVEFYSR